MTNIETEILLTPDFVLTDIFEYFYNIWDGTSYIDENVTFNVTRFEIELENEMYEHKY
jgi:hypothetical protein